MGQRPIHVKLRIVTESVSSYSTPTLGGHRRGNFRPRSGYMAGRDETHQGVPITTSDRSTFLMAPRQMLRIGAWNVRTMNEDGRTEQVAREFRR